jgi:hypothetical protein
VNFSIKNKCEGTGVKVSFVFAREKMKFIPLGYTPIAEREVTPEYKTEDDFTLLIRLVNMFYNKETEISQDLWEALGNRFGIKV